MNRRRMRPQPAARVGHDRNPRERSRPDGGGANLNEQRRPAVWRGVGPVGREGFEPPKPKRLVYSQFPLSTRAPTREPASILFGHAELRCRVRGRHAGGPQRRRPDVPRAGDPVRLQGHRRVGRAGRRPDHDEGPHRGPPGGAAPGARGEARPPRRLAEGDRLRQGRGGVGRHGPPGGDDRRRHLLGEGPRGQQGHQGTGPQGHPVPDAGRAGPRHRQEARRPAGA